MRGLQGMNLLVHGHAVRLGQRVQFGELLLELGDAGELNLMRARGG